MESDRIDDSIYGQQDYQEPPSVQRQYYEPPMMMAPPQMPPPPTKKPSIFDEIDKNVWIMIFVAFILGFFMGKTMQPVILRNL